MLPHLSNHMVLGKAATWPAWHWRSLNFMNQEPLRYSPAVFGPQGQAAALLGGLSVCTSAVPRCLSGSVLA